MKPAVAEIEDARNRAADTGAEPSGLLRIGAPTAFAAAHVVPAAREFMERYPRVEVELRTSDQPVDLFAERLDLAVRIRGLPDSSIRARRLGELRIVIVGTPAYFAAHGRPEHPDDLPRHQCVVRTIETDDATWPFRIGGRLKSVRVGGHFRTDSTPAIHAAVAQGLGLGRTPFWQIRDLVDQGVVEVVLEEFEPARLPIHAVWPATKLPTPKVRLFADALAQRLKNENL